MSFEPQGGKHAVVEVVFGLRLARNVTAKEIEALIAAHSRFKEDLPKVNRTQVFQFAFGDGPPPPHVPLPTPVAGVAFEAMKKDGSLDWRLRVDDNNIFVNCLSYTRWTEIWEQAASYLTLASDYLLQTDNYVTATTLQYIDLFKWAGGIDAYDLSRLLDGDSLLMPSSVLNCGPNWHLYQGWYRNNDLPAPGRLLERIHFDGAVDDKDTPTVKIDSFLQLELKTRMMGTGHFGAPDAPGVKIFAALHDVNKSLLKSVVTSPIADRIGLNV